MIPRIDGSARQDEPSAPTPASSQHPQTIDQAIATFRTGIAAQIDAAQAAHRHETAELNTKIRSLESRLADAEKSRKKSDTMRKGLKSRAFAAVRKAHEAEKEAQKWRVKYEALKEAMQTALKRSI